MPLEIQTKRDIRLLGRAMREDWPTTPQKKKQAMAALMDVIALRDPELTIEAVKVLIKADEANLKRQAVTAQKRKDEDDYRLRLLEIARHLPAGELARITSGNGSHDAGGTGLVQKRE